MHVSEFQNVILMGRFILWIIFIIGCVAIAWAGEPGPRALLTVAGILLITFAAFVAGAAA